MTNDLSFITSENNKLSAVNTELTALLREANEIIDAIKKGDIDSIVITNSEVAKILVSKVADQTYKTFIDNMAEGVVTLQADGIIIYSNGSFARMVNTPLEKIAGINFRQFIPIEYISNIELFFNQHPDNNSKVAISILDSKGMRSHYVVSFNKLHLHDFEVMNLVLTDITSQKNAEEKLSVVNETLRIAIEKRKISEKKIALLNKTLQDNVKTLEDANTEMALFAYIASHDLQEPLRKIFTYTSLLTGKYVDNIDDDGKHYIYTIKSASERMRKLINDIIEYAGLSRTHVFKEVTLESIFKEVLLDLNVMISETKATIMIKDNLPRIEADALQLKQLFQNLCSNALKFVKADVQPVLNIDYKILIGSEIEKMDESRFNEQFCVLSFKDNGIGFDPIYIDKIFKIFQRLNSNTLYKGTGIGLAICKKVVEQHHGYITARSKPGEGALFTIVLPVSQNNRMEHETYDQ